MAMLLFTIEGLTQGQPLSTVKTAAIGACLVSRTHGMSFFTHFFSSGNSLAEELQQNLLSLRCDWSQQLTLIPINMIKGLQLIKKMVLIPQIAGCCFHNTGDIIVYS
jgi:hypothetical protein